MLQFGSIHKLAVQNVGLVYAFEAIVHTLGTYPGANIS